ncbi:Phytanoyl-CoA dioxygenase [Penicillium brevicompactum]
MPYQEVNSEGKHVLCRTENFANSHAGFNGFLRGKRATRLLNQLAGEDMILFKENINYKLSGSGGFAPHIDANAYTHVKNIKHLTILAAVDEMNAANGGLEVVSGSHRMEVPLGQDRCITSDWVESNVWTPAELESGKQNPKHSQMLKGSFLTEASSKDRRAIYATYNCAVEGNLHDQYYADRREVWPATHMRKNGLSYEEGRARYAFGSPMLNARDELVIAALLHDIGQIVPLESTREARMELGPSQANVGRVGHEAIGASYLHSLEFSETVSRLVNSHVAAKRYLTAKSREYYISLSTASQKSLEFQGGPFQGDDLKAFEADPLRDDMVSLRLWDDASKVEGIEAFTPRTQAYLDMITGHLDRQC